MLIGEVRPTEKGIRIVDVDGSHSDLNAHDALDLAVWIQQDKMRLLEIVRRWQKTKEMKEQEEQE